MWASGIRCRTYRSGRERTAMVSIRVNSRVNLIGSIARVRAVVGGVARGRYAASGGAVCAARGGVVGAVARCCRGGATVCAPVVPVAVYSRVCFVAHVGRVGPGGRGGAHGGLVPCSVVGVAVNAWVGFVGYVR